MLKNLRKKQIRIASSSDNNIVIKQWEGRITWVAN